MCFSLVSIWGSRKVKCHNCQRTCLDPGAQRKQTFLCKVLLEHCSIWYRAAEAESVFYSAGSRGWLVWGAGRALTHARHSRWRRASSMEVFGDLTHWSVGLGWVVCGTVSYAMILDAMRSLVLSSLSGPPNVFFHWNTIKQGLPACTQQWQRSVSFFRAWKQGLSL